MNEPCPSFPVRAAIATGVALIGLVLLLVVWVGRNVLLLLFAGVLLAILLSGLADLLRRALPMPRVLSLSIVCLVLLLAAFALVSVLGPGIAAQTDDLIERLPRSYARIREALEGYGWGRALVARVPTPEQAVQRIPDALPTAVGVFSTTLGVVVNLVIVGFIGLYAAFVPSLYVEGAVRLVPPAFRPRAREILDRLGHTLSWWLLGRVASMTTVGIVIAIGLALMDIPLALTLGLISGLLTFVPYIGPILSAVPAVLVVLLDQPWMVGWVVLLYVGVQSAEGYLLTPMIERRTVRLPPAVTITAQVLLGVLVGSLGLILATPLTASAMVLIRALWIEDTLGDRSGAGRGTGESRRSHRPGSST